MVFWASLRVRTHLKLVATTRDPKGFAFILQKDDLISVCDTQKT